MNSHKKIIENWPSDKEVQPYHQLAIDLGENPDTVRKWRERNSIPTRVWQKLLDVAEDKEVSLSFGDLIKTEMEIAS